MTDSVSEFQRHWTRLTQGLGPIQDLVRREIARSGESAQAAHDVRRDGLAASEGRPTRWLGPPHCAQLAHRLGQRELLARESGDEAPSPDVSASLKPSEHTERLTPWDGVRLALQERAENGYEADMDLGKSEYLGESQELEQEYRVRARPILEAYRARGLLTDPELEVHLRLGADRQVLADRLQTLAEILFLD